MKFLVVILTSSWLSSAVNSGNGMVRAGIAEDILTQPFKKSRTLALIGPVEGVEATLSYFFLQFDNPVL